LFFFVGLNDFVLLLRGIVNFFKVFNDFLIDAISMSLKLSLKNSSLSCLFCDCILICLLSSFLCIFHFLELSCCSLFSLILSSFVVLSSSVVKFFKLFVSSSINSIFFFHISFILLDTQFELLLFPRLKRSSNFSFSHVKIVFLLRFFCVEFSLIVLVFSYGFLSLCKIRFFKLFISSNSFFNCALILNLSLLIGIKFGIFRSLECFVSFMRFCSELIFFF